MRIKIIRNMRVVSLLSGKLFGDAS